MLNKIWLIFLKWALMFLILLLTIGIVLFHLASFGILCPNYFLPNGCWLSNNFACLDYQVKHDKFSSLIDLEVSANTLPNATLSINGCKTRHIEHTNNKIMASFECALNKSSFNHPYSILKSSINPCWKGVIFFKKEVYIINNNQIISEGIIRTSESDETIFPSYARIKVKFIKLLRVIFLIFPFALLILLIFILIKIRKKINKMK